MYRGRCLYRITVEMGCNQVTAQGGWKTCVKLNTEDISWSAQLFMWLTLIEVCQFNSKEEKGFAPLTNLGKYANSPGNRACC